LFISIGIKAGKSYILIFYSSLLLCFEKFFFPFSLSEAGDDKIISYEKGPFDKHPIGGKQLYLLTFGHIRQFILKFKAFVGLSACVDKFFQVDPAHFVPFCNFL